MVQLLRRRPFGTAILIGAAGLTLTGQVLVATEFCPQSTGPDVIVSDLPAIQRWGTVGEITAYSIATTSCNFGDAELQWVDTTADHPVIAQHLYKLTDRRLEQIGISFVKHGFGALQDDDCCPDCQPAADFSALGVGCSDPYSASINGNQGGFLGQAGLGPRSDINASTGAFDFPYTFQGQSGDAIYKRLQVENRDLNPLLNPDARYFAEGHYVARDDAIAGNQTNNASHREVVVVGPVGGGYNLAMTGPMHVMQPAIVAWRNADPAVQIETIDVPDDGRYHVAYRATENGDGTWHYEYAVHNLSSHRSVQALRLPVSEDVALSNAEFHDVDYHSGDPYSGLDWSFTHDSGAAEWTTFPFSLLPSANALRWGTLYNFAFDADAPPARAAAELVHFRPGTPAASSVAVLIPVASSCPADLDDSGDVGTTDLLEILVAWGACDDCPADLNDSGAVDFQDLLQLLDAWGPCR